MKIASAWVYAGVSQEVSEWVVIKEGGSLENCTLVDFGTVITWGYNLLINGLYRACNPLTNLLLTSWDIQVGLQKQPKGSLPVTGR